MAVKVEQISKSPLKSGLETASTILTNNVESKHRT